MSESPMIPGGQKGGEPRRGIAVDSRARAGYKDAWPLGQRCGFLRGRPPPRPQDRNRWYWGSSTGTSLASW
jgi:hypothetical protein